MTDDKSAMDQLYVKEILELVHHPRFFLDDIASFTDSSYQKNILCGDEVYVGYDSDHRLCWSGESSIICKASNEYFCMLCTGKRPNEILALTKDIIAYFHDDGPVCSSYQLFDAVKKTPSRLNAVTLIAKAYQKL